MIAKKAAQAGPAPTYEPSPAAKPVVDILEALKKSIAIARQPAASETQPARKGPGKLEEAKSKRPSRKAR